MLSNAPGPRGVRIHPRIIGELLDVPAVGVHDVDVAASPKQNPGAVGGPRGVQIHLRIIGELLDVPPSAFMT